MLDLSGKVDTEIVEAIAAISTAANRLGVQFFVVGATARDFLLQYACGVPTGRATRDVDFGVRVDSWGEFEALVHELEHTFGFVRERSRKHRFHSPVSVLIDLVPFGPIADKDQQITWPPDHDRGMNVEGFESAFDASVETLLRKDPVLVVRTASLPGLALLKLLSWNDVYPERPRDASDLFVLVNSYYETPVLNRLSTDARDLAIEPIPPLNEIGARLLGRDMAVIADYRSATRAVEILNREVQEDGALRLMVHMRGAAGPMTTDDELLSLLRAVQRGFSDISRTP